MRAILALVLATAGLGAAAVATAGPAAAAGQTCYLAAGSSSDGAVAYTVKCVTTGSPGADGSPGGGFVDTCRAAEWRKTHLEISPDDDWPLFCQGKSLCMFRPPVEDTESAGALAEQIPPGSPAYVIEKFCIDNYGDPNGPFGDGWDYFIGGVPPGPPMAARMIAAHGNLVAPAAAIGHSPVVDAVVHLETWFWLAGAPFAEFEGTPAFAVVAVADPIDMTWTYGSGPADSCPDNGVPAAASCARNVYPRSSAGQPGGTYPVEAVRHYAVAYEMFGLPLAIPAGVPVTFDDDPGVVAGLRVVETQVVTD